MHEYRFYVGSSESWHGHWTIRNVGSVAMGTLTKLCGVWDGKREATGVLTVTLQGDAAAQRLAYGLAVTTRNDTVLVVRDVIPGERTLSLTSTSRYVVTMRHGLTAGNRTLYETPADGNETIRDDGAAGWAFAHATFGEYVAYLVNADTTVEAI